MNAPSEAVRAVAAPPSRVPATLAALLGIAFGVAWVIAGVRERDGLAATVDARSRQLAAQAGQVANRSVLEAQLAELRTMHATLVTWLPAGLDAQQARTEVQALAAAHGVELVQAQAGAQDTLEFYGTLTLDVTVRGPPGSVYRFLADLVARPPLKRIAALDLVAAGDAGTALEGRLRVTSYHYVEERAEAAP